MKNKHLVLLIFIFLLQLSSYHSLFSSVKRLKLGISPYIGYRLFNQSRHLDSNMELGINSSVYVGSYWSIGGGLGYLQTFNSDTTESTALMLKTYNTHLTFQYPFFSFDNNSLLFTSVHFCGDSLDMSPRFSIGSGIRYLFKKTNHTSSRTSVRLGYDVLSSFSFEKQYNLLASKQHIAPTFDSISVREDLQPAIYFNSTNVIYMPRPPQNTYTDIDQHWAQDAIHSLHNIGAFSPYSSTFNPDQSLTYNEAIESITQVFSTWLQPNDVFDIQYTIQGHQFYDVSIAIIDEDNIVLNQLYSKKNQTQGSYQDTIPLDQIIHSIAQIPSHYYLLTELSLDSTIIASTKQPLSIESKDVSLLKDPMPLTSSPTKPAYNTIISNVLLHSLNSKQTLKQLDIQQSNQLTISEFIHLIDYVAGLLNIRLSAQRDLKLAPTNGNLITKAEAAYILQRLLDVDAISDDAPFKITGIAYHAPSPSIENQEPPIPKPIKKAIPLSQPKNEVSEVSQSFDYKVILGSFSNYDHAKQFLTVLESFHIDGYIRRPSLLFPDLHLVQAAACQTEKEALQLEGYYTQLGFNPTILVLP